VTPASRSIERDNPDPPKNTDIFRTIKPFGQSAIGLEPGWASLARSHACAAMRHAPWSFTSNSISTVRFSVIPFSFIAQVAIAIAMLPKTVTLVPKTASSNDCNSFPAILFIRATKAETL
jgi:hypothetical protein